MARQMIAIGSQRWYLGQESGRGTAGCEEMRFKDAASAKHFLQFSMRDRMALQSLRALLAAEDLGTTVRRMKDQQVIHEVAQRLATKRLSLWREARRPLIGGTGPAILPAAEAAPPKPSKPPEKKVEKSWIKIELLDAQGNPVPNQPYKVTLPNGKVVTGKLNQNGSARLEDVDPGKCKVVFQELDKIA